VRAAILISLFVLPLLGIGSSIPSGVTLETILHQIPACGPLPKEPAATEDRTNATAPTATEVPLCRIKSGLKLVFVNDAGRTFKQNFLAYFDNSTRPDYNCPLSPCQAWRDIDEGKHTYDILEDGHLNWYLVVDRNRSQLDGGGIRTDLGKRARFPLRLNDAWEVGFDFNRLPVHRKIEVLAWEQVDVPCCGLIWTIHTRLTTAHDFVPGVHSLWKSRTQDLYFSPAHGIFVMWEASAYDTTPAVRWRLLTLTQD